ncbi:MAG: pirin family protein [Bacteroidetes bacterium]|nr:MAG: pirin family protein [Bacteroidota bacterium]
MKKILSIKPLGFPWETQDPFLFCVHHRDEFPRGNEQMGVDEAHLSGRRVGNDFTIKNGWRMYHGRSVPGFPYHPHRGFETITIALEGFIDHSDSLGAAGRFGAGDVQWMTAGSGVLHSEMFPLINRDKGNPTELFQIWLNLPRANKMVAPHFKMLWRENIPVVKEQDNNGNITEVSVVAGELNGNKALNPTPDSWAADPDNAVWVMTIRMEANAQWTLPASKANARRTIFYYKGQHLAVEGKQLTPEHLVNLKSDEEVTLQNGPEASYFLLLQGMPINEPVVQYGPFVMNSEEEIQEAFNEYRRTEFGGWPWPQQEQVHDRDQGRFALHGDGRREEK